MTARTGLEKFDAAVQDCVETGAHDVRISFDHAGDVLGELIALRKQVAAVAELTEASKLTDAALRKFRETGVCPYRELTAASDALSAALANIGGAK